MLSRKIKITVIVVLSFVFLTTGCAHYQLVPANNATPIDNSIQVETPIAWSKSKILGVETWTVDGFRLQRLMFFAGIKNGEPLFDIPSQQKKKLPVFDQSMGSFEISELVEATLSRLDSHAITIAKLRPQSFGGVDGFRFEIGFASESGLKYKGFFAGCLREKRLFGIMYIGTQLYYYQKYENDVEKLLSTLKLI